MNTKQRTTRSALYEHLKSTEIFSAKLEQQFVFLFCGPKNLLSLCF